MKNKADINSLKKNWFKTTSKIFYWGLSYQSVVVYCYMCCWPETKNYNTKAIANHLRMNKQTVAKAIKELLNKGIIRIESLPRKGRIAKYSFTHPDKWAKGESYELMEKNGTPKNETPPKTKV